METGNFVSAKEHYDRLIQEGNDPVNDPPALQSYMDGWDGEAFLSALRLTPACRVLEIGVGSGRLAKRVLEIGCAQLTGIDLSQATLDAAAGHLAAYGNVRLICGEFPKDAPEGPFDRIYASLTFFHIPDKKAAVGKAVSLLAPGGRAVISVDRAQEAVLDFGTRRVRMYPDSAEALARYFAQAGCEVRPIVELDRARLLIAVQNA